MFKGVNSLYDQLLAKHGDSSAAVGIPRDNQALRFSSVTGRLDPSRGFSILDYGCGLAHLYDFMCDQGLSAFTYTGIDINENLLERARRRLPEVNLESRDSLTSRHASFDYTAAIGTFNLVYQDHQSQAEFVQAELRWLYSMTRRCMFVNFMHTEVQFMQIGAWHQDVADVFQFAKSCLSPNVTIDSSYLPYEFTLVVVRP